MENNIQQKHSEMSPAIIEFFRNKLLDKESSLQEMIEERTHEAKSEHGPEALGDLSHYPQHIADMGTEEFSRELDFILVRRQQQELVEIRDALQRIEEGIYGICERTGHEISMKRLEAMPEARFEINISEREELRERPENQLLN